MLATQDDLYWANEYDKMINEMRWQRIWAALLPYIEKWKKESERREWDGGIVVKTAKEDR